VASFLRPEDPPENDLPRTFIDAYAEWANTLTDAPIQYHKAIGASILSTVMTPHISLRTSFGVFVPNIWIMILAGTTLTRKSTSLDIARRLLDDVMDDYLLATDGSPEGLLTELGVRDGKISLFHRDEITGFMSAVIHKEYMSGILEGFTRLYDGQPETRMLRREKIEIKNPYLVIMSGGIKSRMEEIVGMEHIRSGFLPRFIFVTGTTTPDQMRPIGPPSDEEIMPLLGKESPHDRMVSALWKINRFYNEPEKTEEDAPVIKIAGITKLTATPKPKHVRLQGTPEFWQRLQQLEADSRLLGAQSSDPNLYGPLYDRLKNSILKVAILLCGAELHDKITEEDLQKAIYLGEEWLETVTDFALAIEQQPHLNEWEKRCEKIAVWIKAQHPTSHTQTEVMQKFRIRKRDINDIEETLMARKMVLIDPYPNPRSRKGTDIRYHAPSVEIAKRTNREDSYVVQADEEKGRTAPIRISFPKRGRTEE
jgi:Protein of unknown function (DUF3987)